jgi:uncharacterized protein YbbC (DUF1343 family)
MQITMMLPQIKILFLLFLILNGCDTNKQASPSEAILEVPIMDSIITQAMNIKVGASQTDEYLSIIKDKRVALLVNQTSMIGKTHLADSLISLGVMVKKIFAPEHGFRGDADAGEQVKNGKDAKTGVPLISLYGDKKKPGKSELAGIDIVIFDIQDVGVRFYTYISSMSYVMEACAEYGVEFMVLDRPNPNGHYVDGPVLKKGFESFVGLHPIPVVHGMTVGEYAQMVNGEGWLNDGIQCQLKVIKCANYDHSRSYELPVKPSPNLPNNRSIYLYPSLCFFEGTTVNVGRGTDKQFQIYGHPKYQGGDYSYSPKSMPGAKHPKFEDQECHGYDLTTLDHEDIRKEARLNLSYLINYYKSFPQGEDFFLKNNFFDKLAGSNELRSQVLSGLDEDKIRATWQKDLALFKIMRKKYLLYN